MYINYMCSNYIFIGTSFVSNKSQFSIDSLLNYLNATHNITCDTPPLVRTFNHGQSNPTYFIKCGETELVLRKKPVTDNSLVPIHY